MNALYYILFLASLTVYSQKKLVKEFPVDKGVSLIYVDLNNVFTVDIKTHGAPYIKIEAQSEGEYANNFVLHNKIENESMLVSGSISVGIEYPQDKLSAHKVHAIEVSLLIPENKQIVFTSDIANVCLLYTSDAADD